MSNFVNTVADVTPLANPIVIELHDGLTQIDLVSLRQGANIYDHENNMLLPEDIGDNIRGDGQERAVPFDIFCYVFSYPEMTALQNFEPTYLKIKDENIYRALHPLTRSSPNKIGNTDNHIDLSITVYPVFPRPTDTLALTSTDYLAANKL